MARKPRAEEAPADPVPAIIAATLQLAAEKPWSEIPLAEIAAASGLSLIELYRLFPSKLAILDALARRTDAAVLAAPADADDAPRDRLFDVLMRRFDALVPYKPALARMAGEARRLVPEMLPVALTLPHSMRCCPIATGSSGSRAIWAGCSSRRCPPDWRCRARWAGCSKRPAFRRRACVVRSVAACWASPTWQPSASSSKMTAPI